MFAPHEDENPSGDGNKHAGSDSSMRECGAGGHAASTGRRDTADTDKDTAGSEKNTADADRDTADTDRDADADELKVNEADAKADRVDLDVDTDKVDPEADTDKADIAQPHTEKADTVKADKADKADTVKADKADTDKADKADKADFIYEDPDSGHKHDQFAFITHLPSTFLKDEPRIDNKALARRKRRRTTSSELVLLEKEFTKCPRPSKEQREDLARRLSMSVKSVQVWFQNRRQAARRLCKSSSDSDKENDVGRHEKPVRQLVSLPLEDTPDTRDTDTDKQRAANHKVPTHRTHRSLSALMLDVSDGRAIIRPAHDETDAVVAVAHKARAGLARRQRSEPATSTDADVVSSLLSLRGGSWR